jgi:hypothetical protein
MKKKVGFFRRERVEDARLDERVNSDVGLAF